MRPPGRSVEGPPTNQSLFKVVIHTVQLALLVLLVIVELGHENSSLVRQSSVSSAEVVPHRRRALVTCAYCFFSFALDSVLVVQCHHRGPPRHL